MTVCPAMVPPVRLASQGPCRQIVRAVDCLVVNLPWPQRPAGHNARRQLLRLRPRRATLTRDVDGRWLSTALNVAKERAAVTLTVSARERGSAARQPTAGRALVDPAAWRAARGGQARQRSSATGQPFHTSATAPATTAAWAWPARAASGRRESSTMLRPIARRAVRSGTTTATRTPCAARAWASCGALPRRAIERCGLREPSAGHRKRAVCPAVTVMSIASAPEGGPRTARSR